MSRVLHHVPRVAMFLAGAAVAALTIPRRQRVEPDHAALDELKQSISGLQVRIESRETADSLRLSNIEAKLEEHSNRLSDVPCTAQIIGAMEELLTRTMASLDDRLTTQARSIEVLRATVTQTDGLLERVLESLDSLQSYSDPTQPAEDPLLSRPAV